jgi:hypothetical protein
MEKIDHELLDQLFVLGGYKTLLADEFLGVILALEEKPKYKQMRKLKSRASELCMAAIAESAQNGTVIPAWAAQHFIAAFKAIDSMETRSWDEALYKPHASVSKKTRKFEMERKQACIAEIEKWLHSKPRTKFTPFLNSLTLKYGVHEKGVRVLINECKKNPFR